jgi:predicted MFS family arabinose efflux permease
MSMLAMVALGAGEIVGSITMGLIVDHIGAKKSSLFNMMFIASATLVVVIYISEDEYNWVAFLMTFLWGV